MAIRIRPRPVAHRFSFESRCKYKVVYFINQIYFAFSRKKSSSDKYSVLQDLISDAELRLNTALRPQVLHRRCNVHSYDSGGYEK